MFVIFDSVGTSDRDNLQAMATLVHTLVSRVNNPVHDNPTNYIHRLKTNTCAVLLQDRFVDTTLTLVKDRVTWIELKCNRHIRVETLSDCNLGSSSSCSGYEPKPPLVVRDHASQPGDLVSIQVKPKNLTKHCSFAKRPPLEVKLRG